jgi:hypothetical protein
MLCNQCGIREKIDYNGCKVCGYKIRNQEKIISILQNNQWTELELDLILDNILYHKIEVVNELEELLPNKSLKEIVDLIILLHIGGRTPIRIKLKCFSCNKDLIRPIKHFYKDRTYCSYECRDKYKTNYLSGKNSILYKRVLTKCTNCGKDIEVIPANYNIYNSDGDSNNFCSQECYYEYRSKYYVREKHPMFGYHQTQEQKEEARQRILHMISNGIIPQTMTTPHKKIYELLISHGIECENEHLEKYHSIDIYLKQSGLMIEIMGDYWHGSPLKYRYNNLNAQQLKSIKQDKSKHTYIKKYKNIEMLYLWEYDINHNIDLCWELIRKYIDNNGILLNYHSFNYHIQNYNLILNNNIITPYFITQNPYRLQGASGNTNPEVVSPTLYIEGDNIQSVLTQ